MSRADAALAELRKTIRNQISDSQRKQEEVASGMSLGLTIIATVLGCLAAIYFFAPY